MAHSQGEGSCRTIQEILCDVAVCNQRASRLVLDWRDGSGVKSPGCSSTGPGFNSQHPHGSSELSVTPFPGNPTHTHVDNTPNSFKRGKKLKSPPILHETFTFPEQRLLLWAPLGRHIWELLGVLGHVHIFPWVMLSHVHRREHSKLKRQLCVLDM